MITLFEDITKDITDFEQEHLVPMLLESLSSATDHRPVTAKHLVTYFKSIHIEGKEIHTDDVRILKMVAYCRDVLLKPVCGSQKGYYLAQTVEQLQKWKDGYQSRINKMQNVINSANAIEENMRHNIKKAS
ncbi:hypothetical protein ACLOAU_14485 [Niabella sp. CJ426]|uniref:hypothetical protein n=1 Tax=Niabella sp. CJ426 TaxID=3393740 RepID=UPI003CFE632E